MVILPLFLIPGVHVMDDIPTEVALAQQEIGDRVKLIVTSFLGAEQDFCQFVRPEPFLFANSEYYF